MEEAGRVSPEALGVDAERALIDRARAGDTEAFAALYDQHLARVYRHVYYHVGNKADAEDLTQQVFLRLASNAALSADRGPVRRLAAHHRA